MKTEKTKNVKQVHKCYHDITKLIEQFVDSDHDVMEIHCVSDYTNELICARSIGDRVIKLGYKNIAVIRRRKRVFLVRLPI